MSITLSLKQKKVKGEKGGRCHSPDVKNHSTLSSNLIQIPPSLLLYTTRSLDGFFILVVFDHPPPIVVTSSAFLRSTGDTQTERFLLFIPTTKISLFSGPNLPLQYSR